MIKMEDKTYQPNLSELKEVVGNDLFDELCGIMDTAYQAQQKIEYSGDKVLLGWNLKFRKSGRTLCTVYPRPGHFPLLLIVGRKEKARVETLLPTLSEEFREIYNNTTEGMGQRWMLFDFFRHTSAFDDVLKVIRIRRESGN